MTITQETDLSQWNSLELLDNFVREQSAECDSMQRILSHIEIQKQNRGESFNKLEKQNSKLQYVYQEYQS